MALAFKEDGMLISQRLERMAARCDDARRTVSRYLLEHPSAVET